MAVVFAAAAVDIAVVGIVVGIVAVVIVVDIAAAVIVAVDLEIAVHPLLFASSPCSFA